MLASKSNKKSEIPNNIHRRNPQSNSHIPKIETTWNEINFLVHQENTINDKTHQIHETVSKNLIIKY